MTDEFLRVAGMFAPFMVLALVVRYGGEWVLKAVQRYWLR